MSQKSMTKWVNTVLPDKPSKQKKPKTASFADNMLHHPDTKIAAQLVGEQARLAFEIETKAEHELVQEKLNEIDKKLEIARKELATIEAKKDKTPRFKKVRPKPEDIEEEQAEWTIFDKTNFGLLVGGTIICLVIGATNAYAAMINSGALVFIEHPTTAFLLSLIVPVASLAIKQASMFFYYANAKLLYTKVIAGLTAFILLIWTLSFASEYGSPTATPDFSYSEEAGSPFNWLVWLQLLGEMLAASALALGAELIYHKYDPDLETENPDYLAIAMSLNKQQAVTHELTQIRSKYQAQLTQLLAKRDIAMNEAMAAFIAKRERFTAIQKF